MSAVREYREALAKFAKYHARELTHIDPELNDGGAAAARHHLEMLNRINKLMSVEKILIDGWRV